MRTQYKTTVTQFYQHAKCGTICLRRHVLTLLQNHAEFVHGASRPRPSGCGTDAALTLRNATSSIHIAAFRPDTQSTPGLRDSAHAGLNCSRSLAAGIHAAGVLHDPHLLTSAWLNRATSC